MKYRTILGPDDQRPYIVQRQDEKSWLKIWRTVDTFARQYHAEEFIREAAGRHAKHIVGSVIFEYDESDVVVDRLKNQQQQNRSEGVTSADVGSTSAGMAMSPNIASKDYIDKKQFIEMMKSR